MIKLITDRISRYISSIDFHTQNFATFAHLRDDDYADAIAFPVLSILSSFLCVDEIFGPQARVSNIRLVPVGMQRAADIEQRSFWHFPTCVQ